MSYFLIYGMEDGTRVKQFETSEMLKKFLEDWFDDSPVSFMDCIPQDQSEFYCGHIIVIKGEVIIPRPINIVKTFEIDR